MSKLHRDFPLGDVFEFKAIKQAKSQKDIPTDDKGVPYVVQSTVNNMVSRFVNEQYLVDNNEAPVDGNAIVLGVTLPAVSYQKNRFGASQIITARSEHLDEKTGLYLVGVLSKYMEQFSYQRKPGMAIYKAMEVSFPVIENLDPNHEYTVDDIDWQYMRDRIQELERDRIQELDAYLQATGLNNYELTMDEEMALKGFFDNSICWKKFSMRDLGFSIHHGKRLVKQDRLPGNIPLITAGEANQGVAEYIGNDWPTHEDAITVDMFGNCFLHNGVCSGDDNIYFFTSDEWSMKEKEFIVAVINKSLRGKYSYSKQFRQYDADNLCVDMPCNEDGTINHEYIYIYIYQRWRKKQSRRLCSTKKN